MSADSQFQMMTRYPANMDRCRRCGNPRKMHNGDGNCGPVFSATSKFLAKLVFAAGTLAGASWLLASKTAITDGSVAAFACLVALILLASGMALTGRRR
jgi:hypothetical protein